METIDDKENDENYQLLMDLGAEKRKKPKETTFPPSFSFNVEDFHKRKRALFEN